jgi:hypothetical protein
MCWSGEASAAITALGIATTGYAIYRKAPAPIWLALGYFTLMEALQAFTYTVIGECSDPTNQVSTLLGYLHITFQPFFINAVSLYFINQQVAKRIAIPVYAICFACAIIMLVKVYPFPWSPMCSGFRPMCGELLCSYHGNWHIAWSLPINTVWDDVSGYLIAGFIVPMLYGSWRWTLLHLLIGPVFARLTTDNWNEWPAIWCLLSLELLILTFNTRLRDKLHVTRWPGWKWLGAQDLPNR